MKKIKWKSIITIKNVFAGLAEAIDTLTLSATQAFNDKMMASKRLCSTFRKFLTISSELVQIVTIGFTFRGGVAPW